MAKPESLYIVFDTSATNDMTVLEEREREKGGGARSCFFFYGGFNFCLGSYHTANALLSKVQLGALTLNYPPILQ